MRECICCGTQTPAQVHTLDPTRPSILALNVTIYRRTAHKSRRNRKQQLATAGAVRVCEPCLQAMIAAPGKSSKKVQSLAAEIIRTRGTRYSAMLEEPAA